MSLSYRASSQRWYSEVLLILTVSTFVTIAAFILLGTWIWGGQTRAPTWYKLLTLGANPTGALVVVYALVMSCELVAKAATRLADLTIIFFYAITDLTLKGEAWVQRGWLTVMAVKDSERQTSRFVETSFVRWISTVTLAVLLTIATLILWSGSPSQIMQLSLFDCIAHLLVAIAYLLAAMVLGTFCSSRSTITLCG